MDSLTQLTLGAAIGEAVLGKKLGNKAIYWGAAAGTLPDLDVLPGMLLDTPDRLLFHRGFTHSIVFVAIATLIFAQLFYRFYKQHQTTKKEWYLYFGLIFGFGVLIDAFTTYGTQLLWPLLYRFEFNTIFVVDPLFTLPMLITLVLAMFRSKENRIRTRLANAGLMISGIYLLFTIVNKQFINATFNTALEEQNIEYAGMITNPTPLNQVLWTAVVEADDHYLIGYYSHFDEDKNVDFITLQKNHHLLEAFTRFDGVQKIIRFTKGYYTVEKTESGYLINDLRFGKITDWETGKGEFVFRYHINTAKTPPAVSQAERSFEGSGELLEQLWQRMWGQRVFNQNSRP
jgi:inner membrane protein